MSKKTDCAILLDVNNLYVNSQNYGFDPYQSFLKLPLQKIKQIHLAGYTDYGTHIIDTHAENITEPVFTLFEKMLPHLGTVPVNIERDDKIPPFKEMICEINKVEKIYKKAVNHRG